MAFGLSEGSLDWALAHVQKFGDTDIFPYPFEFEAIASSWANIKDYLVKQDLDLWTARSKRTCLTPKGRYAYRISTQLDPLDSLVFLAITYEIGAALEAYRIPAAERIVSSHRFAPEADGQLYDRSSNWSTFIEHCRELSDLEDRTQVVVADISDFFHRIYHHRIENTLDAATGKSDPARILMKLLAQWSGGVSYGVPVGPAPSRLIADVALDDVDQHLRAEGILFCRYSDDYRIFCTSVRDAYEKLSRLADLLYKSHGLTLQQGKTSILSVESFAERHMATPESQELTNLMTSFEGLLQSLDLENRYEEIDYDDLEPEQQELVDQLNLEELLRAQLRNGELDIGLTRFVLRRLAQLNDSGVALELMENAEECYPVMSDIVEYLTELHDVPPEVSLSVGEGLVSLVESSIVAHLPYHRCWLLYPFSSSNVWGQETKFVQLYNGLPESFSRRKLVLSMGRARLFYWFRGGRDGAMDLEPWERRAFLASASCMPADERKYWYNSLRGRLDPLETNVVEWARANPF